MKMRLDLSSLHDQKIMLDGEELKGCVTRLTLAAGPQCLPSVRLDLNLTEGVTVEGDAGDLRIGGTCLPLVMKKPLVVALVESLLRSDEGLMFLEDEVMDLITSGRGG